MSQHNYPAQQNANFNMGYRMSLINSNYAMNPQLYAEPQHVGMSRPWDMVKCSTSYTFISPLF